MTPRVVVVGLGPAGPDLVPPAARAALAGVTRRFVRTTRHPAATVVEEAEALDGFYETSDTFDEVYRRIVEHLVAAAREGPVGYAVPGSPRVLERTVELLGERAAAGEIELEVVPAMSFLDLAWDRLGVDPVEAGVTLVDGHRFAVQAAGRTGPLLVAHCHAARVLSEVKLAYDEPPPEAIVLQRLGLPDETVTPVAWGDLDREIDADHLTSVYIPSVAEPVAAEMVRFDELVRTLRRGCPWDREQTHASLRRHLLEETHETLEALDALETAVPGVGAIDRPDLEAPVELDEHLREELGDLCYQIFFHARLAAERGAFTVADVVRGIHDKLVERHPHVFGDVVATDAETVLDNWEAAKRVAKKRDSALDGIPPSLPVLARALKVQKRAASAGFDEPGGPEVAFADVAEELAEVRADPSEDEVGDLLFAAVQVARRLGHDPEAALRGAVRRFEERFRRVEQMAAEAGVDLADAGIERLRAWWAAAKDASAPGD